MKKMRLLLTGIALVGSQFGIGCAGESAPLEAVSDEDAVELAREALTSTASADYRFPASLDQEIDPLDETELWARVYAPSPMGEGKRYPVLVFLHGNHGDCGDNSVVPRIDESGSYRYYGYCNEGQIVVSNHIGYGYIAEEMAAHGYIVVSVNANRGLSRDDAHPRGRLVLKHLEKLAHWDQGLEPTPPELGFDLRDHVDLSQVGLMGHSQGGRGVMWAYKLTQADTINWTERMGTDLKIRSIFQIAPIDAGPTQDPVDVSLAVLLPLCDGDVPNLEGVTTFDRSMSLQSQTAGGFRATVAVPGANHNFFNTEWQYSDSSSNECVGQVPLFQADTFRFRGPWWSGWYSEGVIGSAVQREVGKQLISRFFLGTVGANRDPSKAALFDPQNPIPSEISAITPIERGFSPSLSPMDRIELEDFKGETGIGPLGEVAWINGVNVNYTTLYEHDGNYRGAHITWDSASDAQVFEPHLTAEGQGVNLQGFDTLDFRVDPANDPERNLTDTLGFSVRLVDGNGALSNPVNVSDYVTLSGRERNHSMLQTVRIPLGDFGPQLPLTSIRGVRFVFDDTRASSGSIYLASIRATRGGIRATPVVSSIEIPTDYPEGYCAQVTVTNRGSERLLGWSVLIDPNESRINDAWNVRLSKSGAYEIASSESWNGVLEPGASTTFGFCATKHGVNWTPEVTGQQ